MLIYIVRPKAADLALNADGSLSVAAVLMFLKVTGELLWGHVAIFWFASAPSSIAVSRYVLLKHRPCTIIESVKPQRLLKFYGYSFPLFVLVCGLPALPYLLMPPSILAVLIGLAIGVTLTLPLSFIAMLAAVLFPAIAVDAKAVSVRNALADISGMYWPIFKVYVVTLSFLSGLNLMMTLLLAGLVYLMRAAGPVTLINSGEFLISMVAIWNAGVMAALSSHVLIAVANKLIARKSMPAVAAARPATPVTVRRAQSEAVRARKSGR